MSSALQAQTTKAVSVSAADSFTDHLSLKSDTKDMDVMLKLVFDEAKNQLTVSVISYRMLFVFWDDVRYKTAIRRRWIHTDRLPYVADNSQKDRFRLTKEYRNSLGKHWKQHIFRRWIEADGLQPVPKDLRMVNDYIEQTFDIQGKRDDVSIRLHDLLLMDEVGKKQNATTYQMTYGKDLNITYQIHIRRDPCTGMEQETAAAQKALESVKKVYGNFASRFKKGTVSSPDALKAFTDLKETLMSQLPEYTDSVACPTLQQLHDEYNQYVDSIRSVEVKVAAVSEEGFIATGKPLNTATVLSAARQLDKMVARCQP